MEFVPLTPAIQEQRSNNSANKPNWEQVNDIELVRYKNPGKVTGDINSNKLKLAKSRPVWINRLLVWFCLAVSQASNKVSSLDPCHGSCKFACDVQSRQCICLRGYKMKGESCHGMTNACFTFLLLRFEFFFISSR